MSITKLEFQQMQERVKRNRNRGTADSCMRCGRPMPANSECPRCWPKAPNKASSEEDREATLHDRVEAECRRRGWLFFHGSMAHRTKRTLGEPDFTILADGDRVFFVECKSKTGKLTREQLGLQMMAAGL